MKTVELYYYSGAGNTKFVAQKTSSQLKKLGHDVRLIRVSQTSVSTAFQDADIYIIGFPIYGLTSPQLVKDLIHQIDGKGKPVGFFCTKALISGNSIQELGQPNGINTVAKMELYMPATDMLAFLAYPQSFTEKIIKFFHSRRIDNRVEKFVSQVLRSNPITVRGKWYVPLSFLIPRKAVEAFHGMYSKLIPQFYSQVDICTKCMKCVRECPRDNIWMDTQGHIQFGTSCDVCLHCVHHCPPHSIQVGRSTLGKTRYRRPSIK